MSYEERSARIIARREARLAAAAQPAKKAKKAAKAVDTEDEVPAEDAG